MKTKTVYISRRDHKKLQAKSFESDLTISNLVRSGLSGLAGLSNIYFDDIRSQPLQVRLNRDDTQLLEKLKKRTGLTYTKLIQEAINISLNTPF